MNCHGGWVSKGPPWLQPFLSFILGSLATWLHFRCQPRIGLGGVHWEEVGSRSREALSRAPRSHLQPGLVGAGVVEDMPLRVSPSLNGSLLALLLLTPMIVYPWVFTGDLSHPQLSRRARPCRMCSFLVSPAIGRGHETLAQGYGRHPGVGTNSWPLLQETVCAKEGPRASSLPFWGLNVPTNPRGHCPW